MKKNQKYIVIGVAAIITILILWYVFKKNPGSNTVIRIGKTGGNTGGTTANTGGNQAPTGFPITWMVYNPKLNPLQSALGVSVDGLLGQNTANALIKLGVDVDSSYTIDNPSDLANLISLASKSNNSGSSSNTPNIGGLASQVGGYLASNDNTSGNGDGTDATDSTTGDTTDDTTDDGSTDDGLGDFG